MAKKKSTMTVRIPDSGREIEVPTGLTGSALQRHVQGVLQAEALAAQQAEAAKLATAQQAEEDRFAALERELASERAKQEVLNKELADLKKASPEAASMVTILQGLTREAKDQFDRNEKQMARMQQFANEHGQALFSAASALNEQNKVVNETVEAKRRDSGRLMNAIALQQGLPAPHPHLLEENDDGN